jgi:hypothetical protein
MTQVSSTLAETHPPPSERHWASRESLPENPGEIGRRGDALAMNKTGRQRIKQETA